MSLRPVACLIPSALLAAAAPVAAATFTKVTSGVVVQDASESTGGAWEDFDADGDPDLFVSCGNLAAANNRLYRNDFGLFFALVPGPVAADGTPSIGGAWGDMDGDGDPDLHVSNRQGVDNLLYRNDGAGAFAPVTTGGPVTSGGNSNSASWVDIDLDGDLDLFVIEFNETNHHWRNDGGVFTAVTTGPHVTETSFSISGVWSDYDRDGDSDLYVANGGNQHNALYRNDGGTFVNVTAAAQLQHGGNTIGASWGDWDNDGWSDLLAANTLGQNEVLYRNLGDGTFERILTGPVVTAGGNSVGSAFGDVDNDGDLDLFVGNDGTDNALFRNDGGGAFTRITTGAIVTDGGQTFGVSLADWNSDGWLDAFAANRLDEDDFLYTNDGGANRWLEVALTGTVSNRTGIGTRVEAYATIGGVPVRQMRERQSQSGYNSAADPRLHFGLGDAATVDSLVVAWPSGLVETLRDVAVDQVLALVEGATLTGAPEAASAPLGALRVAPNPARGDAAIRWSAPGGDTVAVRIFDLRGRLVRSLAPSAHEAVWDGRDDAGRAVAAGTYFAVATGRERTGIARMTRLR